MDQERSVSKKIRKLIFGASRNPQDVSVFHKISLIAFFAWIGLGADGVSSSCYGPQEAFLALHTHTFLSIFVALGTVFTIFIISASYSQTIELFPSGGGGYVVATKLLNPTLGLISGCALLVDYVLTISVSIASGADAVFSLLPVHTVSLKMFTSVIVVLIMIVMNMRGLKESVLALTPIFLTFVVTHFFIIMYAVCKHIPQLPSLTQAGASQLHNSITELGFFGVLLLTLRAYSMGAGTFTGIEAVSNGIPALREPKVKTAHKTMQYMAWSLSFVVLGLMIAYLLYGVQLKEGKTLNAVLLDLMTGSWGTKGRIFVLITLLSEATILFVAAQAGFVDGPRVLANMAKDRWFPTRFATLSDRLVTHNGILIMGSLAIGLIMVTGASVKTLVILYSINVFITFTLSQAGMVRHWWQSRTSVKNWLKRILVNGTGLLLCAFILTFMVVFKFFEGGWFTLLITGSLIILALLIKRHYLNTAKLLHRLNSLLTQVVQEINGDTGMPSTIPQFDPKAKTAVLLVSGFNGIGLHTLFGVIRLFGQTFKNFVFVQVGVVDAGNFKGVTEMANLEQEVKFDLERYVRFIRKQGLYGEGIHRIGVDMVDEVTQLSSELRRRFPNSVVFAGQLIFPHDTFVNKIFHNYAVFSLQQRLYRDGVPFVILPIRV